MGTPENVGVGVGAGAGTEGAGASAEAAGVGTAVAAAFIVATRSFAFGSLFKETAVLLTLLIGAALSALAVEVPQPGQNFAPTLSSCPHFGQTFFCTEAAAPQSAPQTVQKRDPLGISLLHLLQIIICSFLRILPCRPLYGDIPPDRTR